MSKIKIYHTKDGSRLVKLKPEFTFDLYIDDDIDDNISDDKITPDMIYDVLSSLDSADLADIMLDHIQSNRIVTEEDDIPHEEDIPNHKDLIITDDDIKPPKFDPLPVTISDLKKDIVNAMNNGRGYIMYRSDTNIKPEDKSELNLLGFSCYYDNKYICIRWDED